MQLAEKGKCNAGMPRSVTLPSKFLVGHQKKRMTRYNTGSDFPFWLSSFFSFQSSSPYCQAALSWHRGLIKNYFYLNSKISCNFKIQTSHCSQNHPLVDLFWMMVHLMPLWCPSSSSFCTPECQPSVYPMLAHSAWRSRCLPGTENINLNWEKCFKEDWSYLMFLYNLT